MIEIKNLSKQFKVCLYCESVVSITDRKCPNCGAKM